MGFYPIRAWVWVNFSTHGFVNRQKAKPSKFAGLVLGA
jgi:hypothetical protein